LLKVALASIGFAAIGFGSITGDVRKAAMAGDRAAAESALASFKAANGETPEYIQAYSWLARGALNNKRYEEAEKAAAATRKLVAEKLRTRKLDDDKLLPIALGAAIEVQAQVLAARGDRNGALTYLNQQLAAYRQTSMAARIQKNINLLSMVGRAAPPLHAAKWLGPKPPTLASVRGKPVLLFFWAHWCRDCRREIATIARVKQEFGPKGLVVIGPTQLYGYAEGGNDAAPEQEIAYIERVRKDVYAPLIDVPAPVSEENFKVYGASTTPTVVLIGKEGRVAMYHPGALDYEELAQAISKLFTAQSSRRPPVVSRARGRETQAAESRTSATRPSIP
jgi:thiol-disulfide isomerase/thioredoxin